MLFLFSLLQDIASGQFQASLGKASSALASRASSRVVWFVTRRCIIVAITSNLTIKCGSGIPKRFARLTAFQNVYVPASIFEPCKEYLRVVDKTERSVSVTEVYARLSNFTTGTLFFAGRRTHVAVIGRRVVWQMSFVRGRVLSCADVCFALCRALWAGELSAPVEHRRYLQRGALNLTRREQRTRKHGNMLLKSHLA